MNSRFFVCTDCKAYIDAGYRWAYWQLEHPGIVKIGEPFSSEAVVAAADYWRPPADEDSRWLIDQILPAVRDFLSEHRRHKLLYSDLDVDGGVFDDYTQIQTSRSA